MKKWVYTFGNGAAEGRAGDVAILGGKGAHLAEMASLWPACSARLHHYQRSLRSLPPGRTPTPQ